MTWVGIDGYYLKPSWQFAPLFGPTIRRVRALTSAPILIAETGATSDANQPSKIADVFAGIHTYGLLGLVWYNSTNSHGQAFGINSSEALEAFRKGARTYVRPGPLPIQYIIPHRGLWKCNGKEVLHHWLTLNVGASTG